MNTKKTAFSMMLILSLFVNLLVVPFVSVGSAQAATLPVVDDFEAGLPVGLDGTIPIGFNTFADPNSSAAISTTDAAPAPSVPGHVSGNHALKLDLDVVAWAGTTHAFENATSSSWITQDWSAYAGISFYLYGSNSGTDLFVDVLDNRNPGSTKDDAERWTNAFKDNFTGWSLIQIPFASMTRKEIGNGAPNDGFGLTEVHGWAFGTLGTGGTKSYYLDDVSVYGVAPVKPLTVGFTALNYKVNEGGTATVTVKLSKPSSDPLTVQYKTTLGSAIPNRDYFAPVSGTLTFPPNITLQSITVQTIDDGKYQGERGVLVELSNPTGGLALGLPPIARLDILDDETYDPTLLDDFESFPYLWSIQSKAALSNPEIAAGSPLALPGQGAFEHVLQVYQPDRMAAYRFGRTFPIGQDWSDSAGLSFLYYGQKSGKSIQVTLANNQVGAGNPSQWKLVWSDEFNSPTGTAPNPSVWGNQVGDGTVDGIPGWGNDELEYYTPTNAATDGQGNLVITTKAADGTLQCYYGPCKYTSTRLQTKNRFEVAYGRVEARVKVPKGAGLWPAFWMLGTDIDQVSWPQSGEIDIMEHVGRLPNQVFGTLHGPGYSGGSSYGKVLDLGKPVADDYHTFAVEWQPDKITWLLDGVPYFTAAPTDPFLAGKQWVYNHPFYMLLNVAVGGNFGGAVDPETTFPQNTLVDFVRLYQAKPSPAKFTTSFIDSFTGWQKVTIPFTAFQGEDGAVLDLAKIQSLSFLVPGGMRSPVLLDQVRLTCSSNVTVTSLSDRGAGSLYKALGSVCVGGTIHFAPALAGATIINTTALTIGKNVTIDGTAAPGLAISGGGTVRVFEVSATATATIKNLILKDGYGFQLGGGVLNNGKLTLDHVVVTGNTMTTNAGDFWQGGAGIYNGGGATLNLVDSTVSANHAAWSGGGVYSFFDTTTTIVRSTISGNVSDDVGGGIRSLGNITIANSTISGNTATGWHGGAIFHTGPTMDITNSTIANNIGPDWAPSAIFIGSWDPSVEPRVKLTNSIITGNHWYACEHWTAGTVYLTSGGFNLVQDATCSPIAGDLIGVDARLGLLADNGGPTQTHALLVGSPAIDTADDTLCPATDQRGVARPQGAHCDIGSYEAP